MEDSGMQNDTTREQGIEKVRELIKDIEFAMLTTVADDGSLHSRPMATQKADFDGDVWFFTKASSHKAQEISGDSHVNVTYSAPDDNVFVALSGTARMVRDRAKIQELWYPDVAAWFPEGPEDPDIVLLKVAVERAEYWEGPSSIVYAFSLAKACVTGERPEAGDYAKVDLK
jgi:general stress protein 26